MMFYSKQRAHSRLPYVLLPSMLLMPPIVTATCAPPAPIFAAIIAFSLSCVPLLVVAIVHLLFFSQVFYDDAYVYIHSFFGKARHTIPYVKVIRLGQFSPPPFLSRGDRGHIHTLTYHSEHGICSVRFYASFFYSQTDRLKRKLGSYKTADM